MRCSSKSTTFALFMLSALGLGTPACSSSSPGSGADSVDGGSTSGGSTSGGSSGGSSSGSGSSSSGSGGGGTVGDLCSPTADCASGLTCATSGPLLGRCTADCTADLSLCSNKFGANTLCLNASQCARECASASQCPGQGECVLLSSGDSACVTNQNGPPDAAPPPNGGCTNLGGAFGDTVMNGGYRCTPTTGQGPVLGIDQCKNGTWVSAFMCTCQVKSSISGQYDPSDCSDIAAPGTARCGYALDYCEQCDPVGGCQPH